MRNNAAIRPLPQGTNLKPTKKENYEALFKANDNNEVEALFWETYLADLATKYGLVYRPGKELFQIYYPAGKTNNANKQIVNEVTRKINEINRDWAAIQETFNTFEVFSDQELVEEMKVARQELTKLDDERSKFVESLRQEAEVDQEAAIEKYLAEYSKKRKAIQLDFANSQRVKELDKVREKYQKTREKTLSEYLKSTDKDFKELLKKLEFNPQ